MFKFLFYFLCCLTFGFLQYYSFLAHILGAFSVESYHLGFTCFELGCNERFPIIRNGFN
jgi:hypothetical protein